jgi:hypothetical protein
LDHCISNFTSKFVKNWSVPFFINTEKLTRVVIEEDVNNPASQMHTLLSIFAFSHRLPTPEELFVCRVYSTWEELVNFINRFLDARKNGRRVISEGVDSFTISKHEDATFVIINSDQPPHHLQIRLAELILEIEAQPGKLSDASILWILSGDPHCAISGMLYNFQIPHSRVKLDSRNMKKFIRLGIEAHMIPDVVLVTGESGMGKSQKILQEAFELQKIYVRIAATREGTNIQTLI